MSTTLTQQPHVLVTGGLGYIGGCLVPHVRDRNKRVRIIDAALYGLPNPWDERVELVRADIRDGSAVEQALFGIDTVVHLAAIVGDPACALDEIEAISVNRDATIALLDQCRNAGVQSFVFASTCSVYGEGDGQLLTEDSPVNPVSLYAQTKVEAEEAVLAANSPEMATMVLRFATLFGRAPRLRFDLVANLLAARASRGMPITIHGGDQWRPFLHVRDAAAALDHVISANRYSGAMLFNVGSESQNHQLTDLGQIIADTVPGTALTIDPSTIDRRTYRVSFDRFQTQFGPTSGTSLRSGIADLHRYLLENPGINIADPIYDNARYLATAAEPGSATEPAR